MAISVRSEGETATVFATDYLNKLSGEMIERECKRQLEAGCKTLVVNFSETEIVNSIGVSILLGVIDAASNSEASVVFSEVNAETIELFEMLGLTNHVMVMSQEERVKRNESNHRLLLLTLDSQLSTS